MEHGREDVEVPVLVQHAEPELLPGFVT